MADYGATITIQVNITARDEETANTRADLLGELMTKSLMTRKDKWLGDITEIVVEVEEA